MDPAFIAQVKWYDGQSALRHTGTAQLTRDGAIALETAEGRRDVVEAGDIVFVESRGDETIYSVRDNADFRLIFTDPVPPIIAAKLPEKRQYGGWVDKLGLAKASAIFAAVSVVIAAGVLTAPEWLGPRIPPSWERQFGDAMIGDLGNRICSTPESDAALAKMLAAVDPAEQKVRAGIANMDMVNAVALPGGQVLLFDGLLQDAETPEEVAGVLAHEVGHVRERHVMTAVLRQFGLSILLSGADSGLLNNAAGIAAMGYSRDAEREADAYARARLDEAQVSPLGSAAFFERMEERYGGDEDRPALIGWAASHPASGERADAFRDAHREGRNYRDVLSAEEFTALKEACSNDPDVEEFDLF